MIRCIPAELPAKPYGLSLRHIAFEVAAAEEVLPPGRDRRAHCAHALGLRKAAEDAEKADGYQRRIVICLSPGRRGRDWLLDHDERRQIVTQASRHPHDGPPVDVLGAVSLIRAPAARFKLRRLAWPAGADARCGRAVDREDGAFEAHAGAPFWVLVLR